MPEEAPRFESPQISPDDGKAKPSIDFSDAMGTPPKTAVSAEASQKTTVAVEERKKDASKEKPYSHLTYPALDAFAVRTAYYGATGRLFPDMQQIKSVMSELGPAGKATLERMNVLEQHGFKFGPMQAGDAYANKVYPGAKGFLPRNFMLAGYNDEGAKAIKHNGTLGAIYTALGISNGADRDAAGKYVHELGHNEFKSSYDTFQKDPAARAKFERAFTATGELGEAARRHPGMMLREELNALSAQMAANENPSLRYKLFPQLKGLNNLVIEQSFKNGAIGGYVQSNWPYEGLKPKYLPTVEAINMGTALDVELNRGGLYQNGRFNSLSAEAAAERIRKLTNADKILFAGALDKADEAGAMSRFFSNPESRRFLLRSGQTLGAFGVAATMTDVGGAFQYSEGAGYGRVADVATNYAGFEVGMSLGTHLGSIAAGLLKRRMPVLSAIVTPVIGFGGGIVGAQVAHETVGKRLDGVVRNAIDNQ